MGSVYKRGAFWWVAFKVPGGGRVMRSTGLSSAAPELEARKVLLALERELKNSVITAHGDALTVGEYALQWTETRKAAKQTNAAKDLARLKLHVLPSIGNKRLSGVTTGDVRQLVARLRTSGLAPRTVINTYGLVRRLFNDALADEKILTTPCVLKRRDLPKKRDADPKWRASAVFTIGEVEQLLSDGRVPADRRAVYALAFCTGMREGEIAALRWSSIDWDATPLPKLLVVASYTRANKEEKAPKTENPREVPMHPVLQRALREWREKGFVEFFGREPKADDLVVPNRQGAHRTDHSFLPRLHADLETLGLRERRFHDSRRTFISVGRVAGANPDVLRAITHQAAGDQFDQYTTFTWEAMCEAVRALPFTGRMVRQAANQATGTAGATAVATIEGSAMRNAENNDSFQMDGGGLEASHTRVREQSEGVFPSAGEVNEGHRRALKAVPRSNVAADAELISDLRQALEDFERALDRKRLATRLRILLAQARGGAR